MKLIREFNQTWKIVPVLIIENRKRENKEILTYFEFSLTMIPKLDKDIIKR